MAEIGGYDRRAIQPRGNRLRPSLYRAEVLSIGDAEQVTLRIPNSKFQIPKFESGGRRSWRWKGNDDIRDAKVTDGED